MVGPGPGRSRRTTCKGSQNSGLGREKERKEKLVVRLSLRAPGGSLALRLTRGCRSTDCARFRLPSALVPGRPRLLPTLSHSPIDAVHSAPLPVYLCAFTVTTTWPLPAQVGHVSVLAPRQSKQVPILLSPRLRLTPRPLQCLQSLFPLPPQ